MQDEDVLRRLRSAMTQETDAMVIRGVREGVLLADDLVQNTPLLNNPIGRDMLGHIRRAGVMFRFRGLCTSGDLPFAASEVKMQRGNWHCLDIASGDVLAQICRSEEEMEFPVDTPNRQDARLVNPQADLFRDVMPPVLVLSKVPVMYAWLTYGATSKGELSHLCWGVPASDDNEWLAHVNILKAAMTAGSLPPQPSRPDPTNKLRFLEEIEKQIDKRDNEKTG